LGEKRRLVEAATSAPALGEARPAPTLLARVLDGSVMLVPRKLVLGVAATLMVAFLGLLWLVKGQTEPAPRPVAAPAPLPASPPVLEAEERMPTSVAPAPLPAPVAKPAPPVKKAAPARKAARAARPARVPDAEAAKGAREFRPTEL
jgi:hypothetical protein